MKFLMGSVVAFVVSLIFSVVFFSLSDFEGLKQEFVSGKFNINKNFNISLNSGDKGKWEEKSFEFESKEVKKISVSSLSSKILISNSDRENILLKVKIKEDALKQLEDQFIAKISDGVLEIENTKEDSSDLVFGWMDRIEIEIPKNLESSYELESASGKVEVKNVKGGDFNLELAAGNLLVSDSEFKKFEIESAAGSVDLENVSFHKGSVEAAAGRINMKGIKSIEEFEVEAVAGAVNLEMNQSSPRVKISAAAGNVKFSISKENEYNFTLKKSSTVGSVSLKPLHKEEDGDFIFGEGKGLVEIEAMFGSIEVN